MERKEMKMIHSEQKVQYCRSFLQEKDDLFYEKIISLESVFTRQSIPVPK